MALHTCCWLKSVAHVLVVLECCCSGGVWHFQVMDSLVVSLSKFTFPLNPLAFKPVVTFGENEKARIATEAVFTVANRYARAFHRDIVSPSPRISFFPQECNFNTVCIYKEAQKCACTMQTACNAMKPEFGNAWGPAFGHLCLSFHCCTDVSLCGKAHTALTSSPPKPLLIHLRASCATCHVLNEQASHATCTHAMNHMPN